MSGRDTCAVDRPKRIEGVKFVDLFYFKDIKTLPVDVSIVGIKKHCLLVVTRDLHPKFDLYYVNVMIILGILDKLVHLLVILDVAAELLPPRLIHKVIASCIPG